MPPNSVRLTEVDRVALAVVRRQVARHELSAAVRDGCGRAFAFARARGLTAGRNVAIFWDGAIRLDAGVELEAPFAEEEGIVRSATPGGLVACVTHLGPYSQLDAAHTAIREWCATSGHRLVGPNWEIYGHWQHEWNDDASQIRTDVYYQVASRATSTRSPS